MFFCRLQASLGGGGWGLFSPPKLCAIASFLLLPPLKLSWAYAVRNTPLKQHQLVECSSAAPAQHYLSPNPSADARSIALVMLPPSAGSMLSPLLANHLEQSFSSSYLWSTEWPQSSCMCYYKIGLAVEGGGGVRPISPVTWGLRACEFKIHICLRHVGGGYTVYRSAMHNAHPPYCIEQQRKNTVGIFKW